MRTRVLVWVVVGLVVVAGVLFLVLTPRPPKTKTDVAAQVARAVQKLEKLNGEIEQYKATLAPDQVRQLEPKFAELARMAEEVAAKLKAIDPEAREGVDQLREAQKALNEVRREFRETVEKGPKAANM